MRPFDYQRPADLEAAIGLLAPGLAEARALAGGTDLIVRLRDGSLRPRVVVDLKGIVEIDDGIRETEDGLVIGARATMTTILADPRIRARYAALAESAAVVGSVQIRNRATLAGNLCNASPAADTAPALLVGSASVILRGPAGERRVMLDDWFVRSGVTAIRPGEVMTAVELPRPATVPGTVHLRRTRRRGHDLASVTLACSISPDGVTRIAYGSVGPRPVLAIDETGVIADPNSDDRARRARLNEMFRSARPSPTSMRAGPTYRLEMLHVLGVRAVRIALDRLTRGGVMT